MNEIEKLQLESIQTFMQPSPERSKEAARQADRSARGKADQINFSSSYQNLIKQAIEEDNNHSQAVQEARKSLENGDLDTIQSARFAAKGILRIGI